MPGEKITKESQLYRVASFIGLAAVLILVSFLYQLYMTGKDEEEKQEA